jgi:hypothetical protein
VPVALLAGRIDDRRQLCSEGYGHIADINENMDGLNTRINDYTAAVSQQHYYRKLHLDRN